MPYKYVRARGGGKIILSASFEIKKNTPEPLDEVFEGGGECKFT